LPPAWELVAEALFDLIPAALALIAANCLESTQAAALQPVSVAFALSVLMSVPVSLLTISAPNTSQPRMKLQQPVISLSFDSMVYHPCAESWHEILL
jgi:hypothetical protein